MTDIAQLKRRAADLESGKDLDRAIQAYREIVQLFERGAAERGPPPTGTAGDTRRAVQIFSRVEEKNPAQVREVSLELLLQRRRARDEGG